MVVVVIVIVIVGLRLIVFRIIELIKLSKALIEPFNELAFALQVGLHGLLARLDLDARAVVLQP